MKDTADIYDQIQENELNPDLQIIASLCGMESVRLLLRNCQGMNLYIPKISRLDTFISRYIRQNPDKSIKLLANEMKLSEQCLRNYFNYRQNPRR